MIKPRLPMLLSTQERRLSTNSDSSNEPMDISNKTTSSIDTDANNSSSASVIKLKNLTNTKNNNNNTNKNSNSDQNESESSGDDHYQKASQLQNYLLSKEHLNDTTNHFLKIPNINIDNINNNNNNNTIKEAQRLSVPNIHTLLNNNNIDNNTIIHNNNYNTKSTIEDLSKNTYLNSMKNIYPLTTDRIEKFPHLTSIKSSSSLSASSSASPSKSSSSESSSSQSPSPELVPKTIRAQQPQKDSTTDITCLICGIVLLTQHEYTEHLRIHNNRDDSQNCICQICHKVLSSASSLDRHVLVHTGERPFICKYCHVTFTTNGNMHRHMRTHKHRDIDNNYESDGSTDSSSGSNSSRNINNNNIKNYTLKRKSNNINNNKNSIINSSNTTTDDYCDDEIEDETHVKRRLKINNNNNNNDAINNNNDNDVLNNNKTNATESNDQQEYQQFCCPICTRNDFLTMNSLENHMDKEHPSIPAKCRNCDIMFKSYKALNAHTCDLQKSHITQGFKDMTFIDFSSTKFPLIAKSMCEQSIRTPITNQKYECVKCYRAFPCDSALKIHALECGNTDNPQDYSMGMGNSIGMAGCNGGKRRNYSADDTSDEDAKRDDFFAHLDLQNKPLNSSFNSSSIGDSLSSPYASDRSPPPPSHPMQPQPSTSSSASSSSASSSSTASSPSSSSSSALEQRRQSTELPLSITLDIKEERFSPSRSDDLLSSSSPYPFSNLSNLQDSNNNKEFIDIQSMASYLSHKQSKQFLENSPATYNETNKLITPFKIRGNQDMHFNNINTKNNYNSNNNDINSSNNNNNNNNGNSARNNQQSHEIMFNQRIDEEETQDAFTAEFRKMKLRGEFPCKLCSAIFPNLRALKGHNRLHLSAAGSGPYCCNMCPFTIHDKAALIRHMRTHNGDRPYECGLCNYAFTTKANCERHLRNRHGKLTREEVKKSIIYHPSEDSSCDDTAKKIQIYNLSYEDEHCSLPKSRDRSSTPLPHHSGHSSDKEGKIQVKSLDQLTESYDDSDIDKDMNNADADTSPIDLSMDVLDLSKKKKPEEERNVETSIIGDDNDDESLSTANNPINNANTNNNSNNTNDNVKLDLYMMEKNQSFIMAQQKLFAEAFPNLDQNQYLQLSQFYRNLIYSGATGFPMNPFFLQNSFLPSQHIPSQSQSSMPGSSNQQQQQHLQQPPPAPGASDFKNINLNDLSQTVPMFPSNMLMNPMFPIIPPPAPLPQSMQHHHHHQQQKPQFHQLHQQQQQHPETKLLTDQSSAPQPIKTQLTSVIPTSTVTPTSISAPTIANPLNSLSTSINEHFPMNMESSLNRRSMSPLRISPNAQVQLAMAPPQTSRLSSTPGTSTSTSMMKGTGGHNNASSNNPITSLNAKSSSPVNNYHTHHQISSNSHQLQQHSNQSHSPGSVKMVIKNGILMPKQKQRRYRTERPFTCEHCIARFTLRSNMERHIKQQHPQFWAQRQRNGHNVLRRGSGAATIAAAINQNLSNPNQNQKNTNNYSNKNHINNNNNNNNNNNMISHQSSMPTSASSSSSSLLASPSSTSASNNSYISDQVKFAILAQQLKSRTNDIASFHQQQNAIGTTASSERSMNYHHQHQQQQPHNQLITNYPLQNKDNHLRHPYQNQHADGYQYNNYHDEIQENEMKMRFDNDSTLIHREEKLESIENDGNEEEDSNVNEDAADDEDANEGDDEDIGVTADDDDDNERELIIDEDSEPEDLSSLKSSPSGNANNNGVDGVVEVNEAAKLIANNILEHVRKVNNSSNYNGNNNNNNDLNKNDIDSNRDFDVKISQNFINRSAADISDGKTLKDSSNGVGDIDNVNKSSSMNNSTLSTSLSGSSTSSSPQPPPSSLPPKTIPSQIISPSTSEPQPPPHRNEEGDLVSVSRLVDNATMGFNNYFRGDGQSIEHSDEEGLVASGSASDASGSEEQTSSIAVKRDKKKSAYSLAPNRVTCKYCQRKFPWISSLRRHLLTHTGQKPFKCSHCPLLFTTKSNCDRHLTRKHGNVESAISLYVPIDDVLREEITDEQTKLFGGTTGQVQTHQLPSSINHRDSESSIDVERQKNKINVIQSHQLYEQHEQNAIKEQYLYETKRRQQSDMLQNHEQQPASTSSLSPPASSSSLSLPPTLPSHIHLNMKHEQPQQQQPATNITSSELPFKCHLCECSFSDRLSCLGHIKQFHESDFELLLSKGAIESESDCNSHSSSMSSSFNTANSSSASMSDTHDLDKRDDGQSNQNGTGISGGGNGGSRGKYPDYANRKVICAFCMRRFWSTEDLRRHMRTHSGERPFKCEICMRKFTLKHSMLRHQKKHSNSSNIHHQINNTNSGSDLSDDEQMMVNSGHGGVPQTSQHQQQVNGALFMNHINHLLQSPQHHHYHHLHHQPLSVNQSGPSPSTTTSTSNKLSNIPDLIPKDLSWALQHGSTTTTTTNSIADNHKEFLKISNNFHQMQSKYQSNKSPPSTVNPSGTTSLISTSTVTTTITTTTTSITSTSTATTTTTTAASTSSTSTHSTSSTPTTKTVPTTTESTSDLIGNLLGISDKVILNKVLLSSADEAAKLLGVEK